MESEFIEEPKLEALNPPENHDDPMAGISENVDIAEELPSQGERRVTRGRRQKSACDDDEVEEQFDEGTIEYLEEHDPMADISEGTEAADKQQPQSARRTTRGRQQKSASEEQDEEEEQPIEQRKPTQVPKKRKAPATPEIETATPTVPEEKPTSSARAGTNKENSVNEEQCRVCTVTEDLVSLFKKVEQSTVADMLMTICPTVSIARKDFMPQFICNPCLDNVTIAVQLKVQCETTERELRKKLSRSKNKVRRPTGYMVIDAPLESDPPTEEEANDDVEFKVSDIGSISAEDDSEDSDFSAEAKKKKPAPKRGRRKSAAASATPAASKQKKRMKKRASAAEPEVINGSGSSDNEERTSSPVAKKKKKKRATSSKEETPKLTEFPCDECDQVFTRKLSLVLHKKSHEGGRELINCEVCGKQFKIQGAYRTHLERHKEDSFGHNCEKCEKVLTSKSELRRHLAEEHDEQGVMYECGKCKRTFVSEARLLRHKNGRCPGFEMKSKKQDYETYAVGKDLFKSVAPLTTTYWSDSFSD